MIVSPLRQFFLIAGLLALTACQSHQKKNQPPPKRDPRYSVLKTVQGQLFWPDSFDRKSKDYLGTPLAGFDLTIHRLGKDPKTFPSTKTDAEGKFSFDNLHIYNGETLSFVTSYQGRRYCLVRVMRVPIGQRAGSSMDKIDREELFTVVDTRLPIRGEKDYMEFLAKKGLLASPEKMLFDFRFKNGRPVGGENIKPFSTGTYDYWAKDWKDVKLFALPLVPQGKTEWGDDQASHIQQNNLGLDILIDKIPAAFSESKALHKRLDQTFYLDLKVRSLTQGAIKRQGLRRCDLWSLADSAPISIKKEGRLADRKLNGQRWGFGRVDLPDWAKKSASLKGRSIVISPGHGFYLSAKNAASDVDAKNWISPRRFMSRKEHPALEIPGYIEGDGAIFISRYLVMLLDKMDVKSKSLREVRDLTKEGLGHRADFIFDRFNKKADKNLPRFWEQNSKYYMAGGWPELLGRKGDPRSIGRRGSTRAYHGSDSRLTDNAKGLRARVELLRYFAKQNNADAFVSIHSNATGNKASQSSRRGSLSLYLDVAENSNGGANANKGGESLAHLLLDELSQHAGTKKGRAISMRQLGRGLAVLRDTFPYYYQVPPSNSANKTSRFLRSMNPPPNFTDRELIAGKIQNNSNGWYLNPFPKKVPATLIEVGYHDSVEDLALLQQRWFQRRLAEGLLKGLIKYFAEQDAQEK
ncbi:MAG: N-acetylmuramoyl-L-alanine amidase [Planctomycetota bacterium]|nr:N-acetylmuramoyl-L-alanine amidase [Planctomycetota bacterium]